MLGETSRSPVLERLEAHVGEWVTHATVGAGEVARGRLHGRLRAQLHALRHER
jgi:hypothetical protein